MGLPKKKEMLFEYVQSNEVMDIIDIGRITIIHMLCIMFFIAGGDTVNDWMFKDFMELHEYN